MEDLKKRLTAIERKMEELAALVFQFGKATGTAFSQVKSVIEHLTKAVDETRQDLSEYGGVITASTWDTDPF